MTKLQFHSYHLQDRRGKTNYLHGEHLLQEYLCMSFATIENQRLQYAKHNQDILRCEILSNLQDAIANDQNSRVGKRVICPKSIHNSYRNRFCRQV